MKICPTCKATYPDEMTYCPTDGAYLVPVEEMENQGPPSRVGEVLDEKYRLVRLLGAGGMGEVYEAVHVYLNKKVAVKMLRPEYTSNPEAVRRFHREAQSASNIGHENIVEILDFGRLDDGTYYLVMEYLDGLPLSDLIVQGPVDPVRGLDIIYQICDGLAAAHKEGIIHRDMKPENVFLIKRRDGSEQVKILDFGIAKVIHDDVDQSLTKTGTIFGTPYYMSPEQAKGEKLDARSDVYSVGIIMYELFTGVLPFTSESFMGILTQHINTPPKPPTEIKKDLPRVVEEIILRAIEKDRDRRFQSMEEFRDAVVRAKMALMGGRGETRILEPADEETPSGGFPWIPVLAGVLLTAVLAAGGAYYYLGGSDEESTEEILQEVRKAEAQDTPSPMAMADNGKKDAVPMARPAVPPAQEPAKKDEGAAKTGPPARPMAPAKEEDRLVEVKIVTNLDSLNPPPTIIVDGAKEVESPYVFRMKKGSTVSVEVVRKGFVPVRKKIVVDGPKRVMIRLRRAAGHGHGRAGRKQTAPMTVPSRPEPSLPTPPPEPKPKPKPKPRPKPRPKPMKPDPDELWN